MNLFLKILGTASIILILIIINHCFGFITPSLNFLNTYANLILVIVTIFYVIYTKMLLNESIKLNNENQRPIIIVKIIPDEKHFNMFYIYIHNTGRSTAFDLNLKFLPDLPYGETTLNSMPTMQNISNILPGETIKYFFASIPEYINNDDYPKKTTVQLRYYNTPEEISKERKYFKIEYNLNLLERINMLIMTEKGITDIVGELEEIKHGLLILLADKNNENN